jgi:DNA replication protein DnaC
MQRIDDVLADIMGRCKEKVVMFPTKSLEDAPERPKASLAYCGVPVRHLASSLDTYQGNQRLADDLRGLAVSDDSLLLTGKTGCGKTHLAVGVMAEHLRKKPEAIFIGVPELLMRIRASFEKGATVSEMELVDKYSQCGLLVLDDMGAEKTTEFSITTLYIILDRRNANCRKTIVTSNLGLKDISAAYGDRIASRLADMKVINIETMPDHRKKRGNHG